jgi:hypothetical protein
MARRWRLFKRPCASYGFGSPYFFLAFWLNRRVYIHILIYQCMICLGMIISVARYTLMGNQPFHYGG